MHRLQQVGCTVSARRCTEPDGCPAELASRPDPARRPGRGGRPAGGLRLHPVGAAAAPAGTGLTPAQRRERLIAADLASAGLTEVLSFPFIGVADLDAARPARRRRPPEHGPGGQPAGRRPAGDAHHAAHRTAGHGAAQPVPRHRATCRCSRSARSSCPAGTRRAAGGRRSTGARRADAGRPDAALPNQPLHVAAVLAGAGERAGWWGAGRPAGWADAIELARRIGAAAGVPVRVVAAEQAPWHPGRCASIRVGDWPIGFAGELAPKVVERLGLPPADRGSGAEPGRPAGAADPDGADDQRVPPGQPGRGARRARFGAGGGRGPDRCGRAPTSCWSRSGCSTSTAVTRSRPGTGRWRSRWCSGRPTVP